MFFSKAGPTSGDKIPAEPVDPRKSRPYDVAILAITHDLSTYAEAAKESVIKSCNNAARRIPVCHIMVLVSLDHIQPCLQDLTNDGVLYAIIVNATHWVHNSCTLRILHGSTQQGNACTAFIYFTLDCNDC